MQIKLVKAMKVVLAVVRDLAPTSVDLLMQKPQIMGYMKPNMRMEKRDTNGKPRIFEMWG
jgi:hypothetical protein